MPQQRLYFDYVGKILVPYWYVLTVKPGELDWDRPVHYYNAHSPFTYYDYNQFDEFQNNMALKPSDFVLNANRPGQIGILLKFIRRRIEEHGVDPYVITQFILSTPYLDDLMLHLPKENQINILIN
ncbi:hypothetical protein ABXS71_17045 [Bacillus infantis]|uniref:hypothetical protein n=1 Tax=Bacillus infantis TaxID=324767 RepID=UPI00344E62E2